MLSSYREVRFKITGNLSHQRHGAKSHVTEGETRQRFVISTIAYIAVLIGYIDLDAVDLDSEEWSSDINNVTSALKSWFRELPDPLLTLSLHQGFIDAASEQLFTTDDR